MGTGNLEKEDVKNLLFQRVSNGLSICHVQSLGRCEGSNHSFAIPQLFSLYHCGE